MADIRTVDELELDGKRVFCRVDYNVPMDDGAISDATRIEATLPTLQMLRERGARIILGSHFGRPKGTVKPEYSLRPVRDRLSEILAVEVAFASDATDAPSMVSALEPGGVLLLENLRFHPGEEANDDGFAASLAQLADVYVNDAFGASHRAHGSIDALARMFPPEARAGGLLLARELEFLEKVTKVEERPFVAILGGAKIAGKIEPLEALVKLADKLLIGGGMANTFLAARGIGMGASLVDRDSIDLAKRLLAGGERAEIVLPIDLVVTDSLDRPTVVRTVDVEAGVEPGLMAVDIGERSVSRFAEAMSGARIVFWNGPMGVFEKEQFANGTMRIAEAFATIDGATSIVGGGESVEAAKASGFAGSISHISTGGGASLEFISGSRLPGVEVLRRG